MIEVVCGKSAEGTLKYAKSTHKLGEIFCIDDDYSIGNIQCDAFSDERFNQMSEMYSIFPKTIEYMKNSFSKNKKEFEDVVNRAQKGETIRIWIGRRPFELCGICWFISELYKRCKPLPPMIEVKLPELIKKENTIVSFMSFGEISSKEIGLIMKNEEIITPISIMSKVAEWEKLRKENSPLRAIINGQLTSVPIDFYDYFIKNEIEKADDEFNEAELIGNIMGKYKFAISDEFIALRIEEIIKSNKLTPLTKSDSLPYRRILKKIK